MSTITPNGYCKLCRNLTELCKSHAIPKAIFNNIFRNASGKAVAINGDLNTPIQYSSDSWEEYLLCKACETKLNREYDSYGINLLKATFTEQKNKSGLTFKKIDRNKLRLFFLSILWRSSVSKHPNYKNVKLDFIQSETLRTALFNNTNVPHSSFTVAVYKLESFTNIKSLNSENLRTHIMAPFVRNYQNFNSICYIFFGFFIEIFFIKLPKSILTKPGVLYGNSHIFMAPCQEILEVPEAMKMLGTGIDKDDSGKTKIKV